MVLRKRRMRPFLAGVATAGAITIAVMLTRGPGGVPEPASSPEERGSETDANAVSSEIAPRMPPARQGDGSEASTEPPKDGRKDDRIGLLAEPLIPVPRGGAKREQEVGRLEARVRFPDGRPAPGVGFRVYMERSQENDVNSKNSGGKERLIFPWGWRETDPNGLVSVSLPYFSSYDRDGSYVRVNGSLDGYLDVGARYTYDEIWGRTIEADFILDPGMTLDVTVLGVEPSYLDTRLLELCFLSGHLDGPNQYYVIKPATSQFQVQALLPNARLRVSYSDPNDEYDLPDALRDEIDRLDPPPSRLVLPFFRNVDLATVDFGRTFHALAEEQFFFALPDRERIDIPQTYTHPMDMFEAGGGGSPRGLRFSEGEYALFFFDPIFREDAGSFGAYRVRLRRGETRELAHETKPGVAASLRLLGSRGQPLAREVWFQLVASVEGFPEPIEIARYMGTPDQGGRVELGALPPGGELVLWVDISPNPDPPGEEARVHLRLPVEPGARVERELVLPEPAEAH